MTVKRGMCHLSSTTITKFNGTAVVYFFNQHQRKLDPVLQCRLELRRKLSLINNVIISQLGTWSATILIQIA